MTGRNQWLIDLSSKESVWAKELDPIPSMIWTSYSQLRNLAENGQVYGSMLQCKDLFEMLYKIPIIMAMIVIDSDPKYKDGSAYTDIIRTELASPMSMGQWDTLASVIIKKNKDLSLPVSIIEILKKTRSLYSQEVTPNVPSIINWRNEAIGHGALRFEDDDSYKQEIESLIAMLREYFDGEGDTSIKGLYENTFFLIDEKKLTGEISADCFKGNSFILYIEGTQFDVDNYANSHDLRYYLFDSFFCKKNLIKYTNYENGQSELLKNKYFSDLYEKHVIRSDKDFDLFSDYISREEDMILEYLNTPIKYIKPVGLVNKLIDVMDDIGHGVISIFMERGTGKSAFANQMSGLYHRVSLIKNSFSRCYHVQNTALRGMRDFVNSLNFSFRHSYDAFQDMWGSNEAMPTLNDDTDDPAKDMSEFLNYYHERYRRDYTILLIDGIDEANEMSQEILNYLPSPDMLDEGVFIVLLSRFKDEETVHGSSRRYIETAEKASQACISMHRKDDINIKILKECISSQIREGNLPEDTDIDMLVKKADHRFLFLKAYLAVGPDMDLDSNDEYSFIRSYMDHIMSFYGHIQIRKLQEIAATIALFPSISIQKIHEYMNCPEITYEFVGLLNVLLPVLTIRHVDGEDIYEFADAVYAEYVLSQYTDVEGTIIDFFYDSMAIHLSDYLEGNGFRRISKTDNNNKEEQQHLTRSIVFFSEGIISIWDKSKDNDTLRKGFFSKHTPLCLTFRLIDDDWAFNGYGAYLRRELQDSLCSAIYYCLQNDSDPPARKWSSDLNHIYTQKCSDVADDLETLYWSKYCIYNASMFTDVCRYALEKRNSLDISEWLWLFEKEPNDEIVNALSTDIDLAEAFTDYYLNREVPDQLEWLKALADIILDPEKEETVLNNLLDQYLSSCFYDQYEEDAKECLSKIKSKGYPLDESIFPEGIEVLEEQLENGTYQAEQEKKRIQKTIDDLLDFDTPLFNADSDFEHDRFILSTSSEDSNIEEFKKLYAAYYKRICYEKDAGRLSVLITHDTLLYFHIVDMLKNEYGDKEEFFSGIKYWISEIKQYIGTDTYFAARVLMGLMNEGVKWLDSNGREEEGITMLEEAVCNYSSLAFFSQHHTRMGTNLTAGVFEKILSNIYCTDDAIALLKRFRKAGMEDRFDTLMLRIEKGVKEIDSILTVNNDFLAKLELQKFQFVRYRKKIGFTSSFDDYIEREIDNFKNKIKKELNDLSRNTDFTDIAFNVELVMEYMWQTGQWERADEICDSLTKILVIRDGSTDSVIKKSIQLELDKIARCKELTKMMALQGVDAEGKPLHGLTENPEVDRFFGLSSYRFSTHKTIYNTLFLTFASGYTDKWLQGFDPLDD
ncbi:MAG: ATP-binding protein [Lachnospiraceae bacterium]|nr:ATP-binding protein [Lachnospiraceae bacterium]